MRIAAGQFWDTADERLRFIKQLGIDEIQMNMWSGSPDLPGEKRWEFMDLLRLRNKVEDYGLKLAVIENAPLSWTDKIALGLPGRDEQIENYQEIIRNMGRAGIPMLGYNFMPNWVWRTSRTTPGRGGAAFTSFDMEQAEKAPLTYGRVISEDEMWDNYTYFIKAVLPVAEESGVKLAIHPDDPPVPELGGVARLFRNFENFKRAILEIAPSEYHGLNFCQGCWTEMGINLPEVIDYFGTRGKLFYVHFRAVKGTVPNFRECFVNEGDVSMVEAMRAYKKAGFKGFFLDDHVPHMVDDTQWGHRARAYAIGYITAMIEAVMAE